MRTTVAALVMLATACSEVRFVDDDGASQGGGSAQPPSSGGATNTGGATASGGAGPSVFACSGATLAQVGEAERIPRSEEQTSHELNSLVPGPGTEVLLALQVTGSPDADFEHAVGLTRLSAWGAWPPAIDAPTVLPFESSFHASPTGTGPDGPYVVVSTDEGALLVSGLPDNLDNGVLVSSPGSPRVAFAVAGGGEYFVRTYSTGWEWSATKLWPSGDVGEDPNPGCMFVIADSAVAVGGGFLVMTAGGYPEGPGCESELTVNVVRYQPTASAELTDALTLSVPEAEPLWDGLLPRSDGAWLLYVQYEGVDYWGRAYAQRLDAAGEPVGAAVEITDEAIAGAGPLGDGFAVAIATSPYDAEVRVYDDGGELRGTGSVTTTSSSWFFGGAKFVASPDESSLLVAFSEYDSAEQSRALVTRFDCAP